VSRSEAVWLAVAVIAVSTSAPLIREAAAPALAVAFWRNGLASAGLVPAAALASRRRRLMPAAEADPRQGVAIPMRTWLLAAAAGLLLAAHFAAWISSLSSTTVAASVALVATQPVWTALLGRATGERLAPVAWLGIALALVGVVVVTGVDVTTSGRALRGDLLALAGGVLAAGYVSIGSVARRRLTTTDYTAACYSVAAAALLVAAVAAGQPLAGFRLRTWLCILAITAGPQLLGHSVFNRLLRSVGPTVVSVAVLGEIVGSALLAAWWFGERPPAGLAPATVCIIAGVALVIRGRSAELEAEVVAG
jgi:drug/metabolite transporter (DMT)-like permease